MWAILLLTLPTRPNAVRLRIWRALKVLGCAALRDGAYLLPIDRVTAFDAIAVEVREHGGAASVLALSARDATQQAEVLRLFDRGEAFGQWRAGALELHRALRSFDEAEARRRLRSTADALQALRSIDYYPGPAAEQAAAALEALRSEFDACFAHGEPRPRAAGTLPRLDVGKFRARRWATRARPWVDRLACAWLIRRFIDPEAEFVWLEAADGPPRTPRGALGFDYDGARFTHAGALVTFEVIAAAFGLGADARLRRIGAAVHFLDVGGIPVAEAAGLEAVLAGLRATHVDDDDALLGAASVVFDALYAAPGDAP